jgi:uncharacterized membrane protein YtjA (UPF0391 family)
MLGWMLIFLLMTIIAALAEITGAISIGPALIASALFTVLLVLSALARFMRGRA